MAKDDPKGCSFRETKAHARPLTRDRSAATRYGLSMLTLGVALTWRARAVDFNDISTDALVVFVPGRTH